MSLADEKQDALAAAYQAVFDNPHFAEGHAVLDDILRNAGLLDAGSPQDSSTAMVWSAGRRSLAVFILNRLSRSPGELALLRRQMAADDLHGFTAHPPTGAEPI